MRLMSTPSMAMDPDSGLMSPRISLRIVDFPEPLPPRMIAGIGVVDVAERDDRKGHVQG
jgi:hypothetical protein